MYEMVGENEFDQKDYDMTDTLTNHTCVVALTLIHPLKPQKAYIPPEKSRSQ